ncbi:MULTISPECIES: 2-nitropropane dioxygenase [unclassified Microbacterium]|uniref:2-nitropropane dioxygenase n=1 Tax=unclassified Microbacterium TaxID=2609290 RepID=UPI00365272F0
MSAEIVERIPPGVRLEMSRAGVQVIAERVGARLLHIKGSMTDPALLGPRFVGTDVDVLVEPAGIPALHRALLAQGWTVYSTFRNNSSFEHAQTYFHPDWGHLDLHRRFPGVGIADDRAFEVLWADRAEARAAGLPCAVPSITAQAMLLTLNAARAGGMGDTAARVWDALDEPARRDCLALVERLDAAVAFAAAHGELERYAHRREYLLWKVASQGGTRTQDWMGRVRAGRTLRDRIGLVLRAPLVNTERLTHKLGRRPRPAEIAREFLVRTSQGVREVTLAVATRFRGGAAPGETSAPRAPATDPTPTDRSSNGGEA